MKIIDEKGRLFGKINLIDFLVAILCLLFLIPMFDFGYKLWSKTKTIVKTETKFIDVLVECKFIEIEPPIAKIISVGDKEFLLGKHLEKQVMAEIKSLGDIQPFVYEFRVRDKENLVFPSRYQNQIMATLQVKAENRYPELYYKDRRLVINQDFFFTTDKYTVKTVIFGIKPADKIPFSLTSSSDSRIEDLRREIIDTANMLDKFKLYVDQNLVTRIGNLEIKSADAESSFGDLKSYLDRDLEKRLADAESINRDLEKRLADAENLAGDLKFYIDRELRKRLADTGNLFRRLKIFIDRDLEKRNRELEAKIRDLKLKIAKLENMIELILRR